MNSFGFLHKETQGKQVLSTVVFLVFVWMASVVVRASFIAGGNFPYWFDLGRDAVVSREILEKGDIKVQGPTASGTNDSIFHGVLYYYVIGPLYTFLGGDPRLVIVVVMGLASLGCVPLYFLASSFSGKRSVAMVATILTIFSYELFVGTTWLSNPVIAEVSLPLFFWLYWLVFFQRRLSLFPVLLLSLAITHQAAIVFAPWWGLVLMGFLREYYQKSLSEWKLKTVAIGVLCYVLGISTMIVAQVKAFQAGIFGVSSVGEYVAMGQELTMRIGSGLVGLLYLKSVHSLFPTMPVLSLIVVVVLWKYFRRTLPDDKQQFVVLMLTSPLWLLAWHYRYVYHAFMALELVGILLLSMVIVEIAKNKKEVVGVLLALGIMGLYGMSNLSAISTAVSTKSGTYFVPQGAYLSDLLDAVDFSYQHAQGQPFTISTMTNPYGYNTLWAYLYSWYGIKQYGYAPQWYGPDQEGIFGGDLLERASKPAKLHVSIREPREGMPVWLYDQFDTEQEKIATSGGKQFFGSVEVRVHETSP